MDKGIPVLLLPGNCRWSPLDVRPMTSTTDTLDDLREYDASAVLDAVTRERRTADLAEARLLDLAVHWVDLHPVTEQHRAATPHHESGLFGGPEGRPGLAGDGTPGIAEFAVEELAAALGMSYRSGLRLCEEAVELCFRLPRLWALVQDGRLQAWKARLVAKETSGPLPRGGGLRGQARRDPGPSQPVAAAEGCRPRGPHAVRPRPGRRRRAARPGAARRVVRPPGVDRDHPGHRPARHVGRARPAAVGRGPGDRDGTARRHPSARRPAGRCAGDAGPPAACARPRRRDRARRSRSPGAADHALPVA